MNSDNFIDFEDKLYMNPQTTVDESNQFIENLRNLQQQDTERISQETYNLGAQIPSNLGGLTGAEATFAERYQAPQFEQAVQQLKATAQADALNTALNNLKNQLNERYQNAYNAAKKRAAARARASSGSGGGSATTTSQTPEGTVTTDTYTPTYTGEAGGTMVMNADTANTGMYSLDPGDIGVYDINTGKTLSRTVDGKTYTADEWNKKYSTATKVTNEDKWRENPYIGWLFQKL